jgi:hypothetical protein
MNAAALAPLIVIGLAFIGYCLYDLYRLPAARYLPKPAWAVITLVSIPLGGILYLLLGRTSGNRSDRRDG